MPVEIKELHIRVTVNPGSDKPARAAAGEAAKGGEGGGDKDAIVAECVEQVLQIMQSKRER
jgi:hypothetical protein